MGGEFGCISTLNDTPFSSLLNGVSRGEFRSQPPFLPTPPYTPAQLEPSAAGRAFPSQASVFCGDTQWWPLRGTRCEALKGKTKPNASISHLP